VAPTRVAFLVLDGLPPEVAGHEVTPVLLAWCDDSGTQPRTVPAVLPASTYPNHATFVTGEHPPVHGIVGNHVRCDDGRFRAARKIGPRVPTIFDAVAAAGLESSVVVGDQDLIGVMGANAASSHWPPGGAVPDGARTDAHGYLHDDVTLPVLLEALRGDAELVVGHLNAPDTAGHVNGPVGARDAYRATDARLDPIREAIEGRRGDTVTIIVSDHAMEPVTEPEPIDLTAALDGTGLTWFPEGTAALVYGEHADVAELLGATAGVAGVEALAPDLHLVWADEGRWLCFAGVPGEPGMHGSPRTAMQLAAVVGTDPSVRELDDRVGTVGFDATSWYGELCGLLGIT
jgi:hypothetical protein